MREDESHTAWRPREYECSEYGSGRPEEHTNWRERDEGGVSVTNTDEKE
jgi:hypothetical protein